MGEASGFEAARRLGRADISLEVIKKKTDEALHEPKDIEFIIQVEPSIHILCSSYYR